MTEALSAVAFEVKVGQRVSGKDLTGLRKLRDGLHVMPVDRLWREVLR